MKSSKRRILLKNSFIIVLIIVTSNFSFANSGPVIMENSPSFSIAPMDSTPIEITKEFLQFDLTQERGEIAKVTAIYEMKNTSEKSINQAMIFPVVNALREGGINSVSIKANNNPIDFSSVMIEEIPLIKRSINFRNGLNKEVEELIKVDNIINLLQERKEFNPKSFKLDDIVRVYTLHIPISKDHYQAEIEYEILDYYNQKILFSNFDYYSIYKDGKGKLGTWSNPNNAKNKSDKRAYIAILGEVEEDKIVVNSVTNQLITYEEMILGDFLNYIINERINSRNEARLSSYYNNYGVIYEPMIEEIDTAFIGGINGFNIDSFAFNYDFRSYLGAFLYSVNFEPNSTVLVSVEYEMQATLDRSKTRDFAYNYLYLLNPASKWKDFGELVIEIIPNENHPYIIDSSVHLTKNEFGTYTAILSGLPDKDLFFTTYKTNRPDPPVRVIILFSSIVVFLGIFLIQKRVNSNKKRYDKAS